MASYRHLARIAVMQTIFELEFIENHVKELKKKRDVLDILKYNINNLPKKITDISFAENTVKGIIKHKRKIKSVIEEAAPAWPIDKVAPVDRALLEIGVFEILFSKDVPPVVSINEAIEIAKVYGDTNSSKFINGVLSTVMTKYKKDSSNKKK
jgi:N utilization substance protein B